MLTWWIMGALAGPAQDVDQQIIVWGDRFARWDRRFYVETEVVPIAPMKLPRLRNAELRVVALQVRTVLACSRFATQGAHQLEVRCRIEDIGLLGLPHRRDDAPRHDIVLPELDATLTGTEVELQVTDQGRVFALGLEGFETTNRRSRERREILRQIVWRVLAPFDLKLPDVIMPSMEWKTHQTALFAWPSKKAAHGGAELAHVMTPVGAHLLVQTIGEATLEDGGIEVQMEDDDGTASFATLAELRFAFRLDGVALFEPETGILVERVFAVRGDATASSGSAIASRRYLHSGRIAMLGPADRPDVGASRSVAREAWTPLGVSLP